MWVVKINEIMLLEKKIKIKINKKNIEHIKSKGYDVNLKDIVEIKTEDINHGSHRIVKVKCDICGNEKEIMFQKYIKNINNGGFYACSSGCAQDKVKKTSMDKFGSKYYMQTKEYRDSVKKTNFKKYGVEYHLQSEEVKDKIKNTNLKKYGVENPFESDMIKEKIKNTNLKKYGVENPFESDMIKEKIKNTNLKKYGVENPQKNIDIRKRTKQNNFKKYGVYNTSQLNWVKEKVEKTNLKKYGVKSHFQLKDNIKKAIDKKRYNWYNKIRNEYDYNFLEVNYEDKYFIIECDKGHNYKILFKNFYLRNLINTINCTICNPMNSSSISGQEKNIYMNYIRKTIII